MNAAPSIQYLTRQRVDETSWNRCIDAAVNGRIYAQSLYLDQMAGEWDALVLGDYEAVMPLPWRKKWGTYYIYQPFLTAQLGLFAEQVSPELLQQFLHAIPEKFRLWEFSLNSGNLFEIPPFKLYQRKNYVLPLLHSYDQLYAGYRDHIRRNTKKSLQFGNREIKEPPLHEVIALAKLQDATLKDSELQRFISLFTRLQREGKATTYGIASERGQLLASAAFITDNRRAYYILAGNHPNGRTLSASHSLIDYFIRENAGKPLLLDFEGSDIRSLAFFYSSFGAVEENYAAIQMNRLPWYLKWARKEK
jgi:hypothetical protein